MTSAEITARGRAMREWCDRIRARGDVATTEEREDLPYLRVMWRFARAAEQRRNGGAHG